MTTPLQKGIMTALRGAAERVQDDWDMPPVLVSLRIKGDGLEITPWPVPSSLWDRVHPPAVLEAIGNTLGRANVDWKASAQDVCAIGFLTEGWTVAPELMDDPVVQEHAGRHDLGSYPGRIEVRIMSAVDRNGTSYLLQWDRGKGVAIESICQPGEHTSLGGLVFHALDLIAEQIFGTKPPGRVMSADIGVTGN